MSGGGTAARAARPPFRTVLLLSLLLVADATVLFAHFGRAYAGPDAPGYFFQARLLATEGAAAWRPESPAEWLVVHYVDDGQGVLRSRYPPGFALMLAAAYRIGGPVAALAVNPVLVLLSVLALFLLARRSVGDGLAVLAAALLGTLPAMLEHALLGFAHIPVMFLLLVGLYLLDRWLETERPIFGLAAGICLGAIPTVRYADVVLGLGVIVALVYRAVGRGTLVTRIAWPAAGALLPIALLLLYHAQVFGSPLRTGYTPSDEAAAFGLEYVRRNWLGYFRALMTDAGPLTVFGTAGMAAMIAWKNERQRGLLLLTSSLALLAVYLAYYWTLQDFRFVLPIVPLLILAAVTFVARATTSEARSAVAAALLALHLALALPDAFSRLRRTGTDVARAEAALAALEQAVPPGSVVVAPLGLNTNLAFDGRWRTAEARLLAVGPPPPLPPEVPPPFDEAGRRQPSPIQPGLGATLRARYAGLTPADRSRAVLEDLLAWSATGSVFWINPGPELDLTKDVLAEFGEFRLLEEVALPPIPEGAQGFGSPRAHGHPGFWTLPDTLRIYAFVRR
jgi:4-amino-4-deoxy-L-arabinose transferase-like glycosyltransferase